MAEQVDAVVVGLGAGGENVAGRLADAGLDTVGVEQRLVGGECPYWACIPSKIMVRAGNLVAEGHRIPGMAGTAMVQEDWRPVARNIREATAGWDDRAAVDRLTSRGVRFLRGTGRLTAPGEVTVEDPEGRETVLWPTRAIVIGVGTEPSIPPLPGLAGTPYWTSREAIEAERAPSSLLVLGGGPAGLELGQAFSRFGTAVTVVEAAPRLLSREEPEADEVLMRVLTAEGLEIHTGAVASRVGYTEAARQPDRSRQAVASVPPNPTVPPTPLSAVLSGHPGLLSPPELANSGGTGFTLLCERGERFFAERLLVTTGRRADLARIGASVLGVDPSVSFLPVDERMRVVPASGSRPGVWALGDVTGKGAYTHMSMYQADLVVRGILGEGGPPAAYHAVPRVTFTDPEVGAVGMTEAEAKEQGLPVMVGRADIAASGRGLIHRSGNEGFVKLVADSMRQVLVGATSVGPTGGEVLGALTVAVHARVPLDTLGGMIWAFPTFHRVVADALADLRAV